MAKLSDNQKMVLCMSHAFSKANGAFVHLIRVMKDPPFHGSSCKVIKASACTIPTAGIAAMLLRASPSGKYHETAYLRLAAI